ncbi:imidazole-4-carboxamide isomerase [Pseudomonas syringae pv. aptata]|uniref:Imidazole-4-carboxamide isomerase n=1 Tax=Pseudomonas syringae pv. aptata TaxID=83167 RepID=A0A3M5WJV6_PSEAP|nr:imidazole-4-carboxamide isomerase [Pseudomonas syringae pv. aptata]
MQLAALSDQGISMLIIPAIDLKDGACVRLRQGRMEDSTVFSDDPVAMAAKWVEGGCRRLHLVDLNGAFEGQPVNGDVVTAIARRYPNLPIQIGGVAAASVRWKPSSITSRRA